MTIWQKDLERVKKSPSVIIERAIESPLDLNVAMKLSNGVNQQLNSVIKFHMSSIAAVEDVLS